MSIWVHLPTHLWQLEVGIFLDPRTLTICSTVCRRWHEIFSEDVLWRALFQIKFVLYYNLQPLVWNQDELTLERKIDWKMSFIRAVEERQNLVHVIVNGSPCELQFNRTEHSNTDGARMFFVPKQPFSFHWLPHLPHVSRLALTPSESIIHPYVNHVGPPVAVKLDILGQIIDFGDKITYCVTSTQFLRDGRFVYLYEQPRRLNVERAIFEFDPERESLQLVEVSVDPMRLATLKRRAQNYRTMITRHGVWLT
eukprot:TRINITY_DN2174_c0_g2_i4.p1 TRINITY_DN2174_c0_g2~~TRINITY_DN2174_c0_g2_i4.p1  ORF type:complete len:253 (+),score=28.41 TRINITY_DN2174_c0_g2_i4:68-826(+)